MSEWQPIETAPKDGTRILTCCQCNTGPVIEIAAWGKYGRRSHAWKHDYAAGRKMFLAPEWWQPLPVPPNA